LQQELSDTSTASSIRPLGVFDSGLGGLTVVRALRRVLPHEKIVYLGDTARVPYGIKSPATVTRFAEDDARFLLGFAPKIIVVACNTASSLALDSLRIKLPMPAVGVVEPGAHAAVDASSTKRIAVIGTEATVASNAYPKAIRKLEPDAEVLQKACPLLVPLVEEGREPADPIVISVLQEYLQPLLAATPDVLLLACTHYPLLEDTIQAIAGPTVRVIDSATQAALAVKKLLSDLHLLAAAQSPPQPAFYVTDNPGRFRRVGERFLQAPLTSVTLLSLDVLQSDDSSSLQFSGEHQR
jgi:glutamate racemase